MNRSLEFGTTTPKESNDYSSSQLAESNEINDEFTSILKEPVSKKSRTCKFDKEYLKFRFSWTGDEN
ncbi:hypothetical protein TNCV_3942321 [Trichonephila clavipes]|nr:hypothetical protein TNCV_3942321 [Trichonephila clavipes]